MHSCLFEGHVEHHRLQPVDHRFRYRLYMTYLDLEELPHLFDSGLISSSWFAPCSFRRADHFGNRGQTLSDSIADLVESETGDRPDGPIRVLTHLRTFGVYFSPINVYYVFNAADTEMTSMVAEVTNTPWRESHMYVLWDGNRDAEAGRSCYRNNKSFHVSPFMSMDAEYHWRVTEPGDDLFLQIENHRVGGRFFRATLGMQRHLLNRSNLNRMLFRHSMMTARVSAAIYFEALRLWAKGCPYHPHPRDAARSVS